MSQSTPRQRPLSIPGIPYPRPYYTYLAPSCDHAKKSVHRLPPVPVFVRSTSICINLPMIHRRERHIGSIFFVGFSNDKCCVRPCIAPPSYKVILAPGNIGGRRFVHFFFPPHTPPRLQLSEKKTRRASPLRCVVGEQSMC